MLVLSRQRDETIMIGDDIEITIVDIRGDKVRLGITAPTTVPVHRKEVYDAIQKENREAAKFRMEDLPNLPKGSVRPGPGLPASGAPPRPPGVPPMRPGQSGHSVNEGKGASHPSQGTPPAASPGVPPKAPHGSEPPAAPGAGPTPG